MSLRSAAAAALCAGLPAVAFAQQPAPQPPSAQVEWHRPAAAPSVVVERTGGGVTPAAAVVRADPPAIIPGIPAPMSEAQPKTPAPAPATLPKTPTPAPAALTSPRLAPAAATAPVDVAPKPEPIVVAPDVRFTYQVNVAPAACDTGCGPDGCFWGRFEWLYWAGSGQVLPPLVTVAPPGTPRAAAGVLGQPTTLTRFGGARANNDFRDGFRFTGGWWTDDARTTGYELDFFFLSRSREAAAASSDGSAVIARPFFDAVAGVPAAELVSFPGVLAGSVTADATSRVIGGGVSRLSNLCCDPCGRVDLVVGFRYLHVGDAVNVTQNLTALDVASRVTPGTTFVVNDRFATSNDFYGGVIGLTGERRYGAFFVGGKVSVALGGVVQTTTIDGSTAIGG
ncbi:MAG TPA: BBP7 family outer membrane beta-barrel protein, partial [Urbifossiella sp.]|nr:BBP7 family outer membrane beta-barrel protein [Urbifossiella sp.]